LQLPADALESRLRIEGVAPTGQNSKIRVLYELAPIRQELAKSGAPGWVSMSDCHANPLYDGLPRRNLVKNTGVAVQFDTGAVPKKTPIPPQITTPDAEAIRGQSEARFRW